MLLIQKERSLCQIRSMKEIYLSSTLLIIESKKKTQVVT